MDRFYTRFIVEKAMEDGDERIIDGVASTSDIDRVGDIVEPEGARFKTPMPLLWQHDSMLPVGTVERLTPSKKQIRFRARIARVDGPPGLKARVDEAWASVKAGLIRAVSIGFRTIEHSLTADNGVHFREWEMLELSLVTIPANPNATITQIRAFHDERGRSAADTSNARSRRVVSMTPAGVAAKSETQKARKQAMNIAEQIKAVEDDIRRKSERMLEIQKKSIEGGRSKDAAEKDEFDQLAADVETLNGELADLKKLESLQAATAAPVQAKSAQQAAASRAEPQRSVIFNNKRAQPGQGFAQAMICRTVGKLTGINPAELAREHYSYDPRIEALTKNLVMKAAVEGAVTSASAWGGVLANPQDLVTEFIEFMRPMMLIGKLAGIKRVPFNYEIVRQTAASTAYWTGQGKPAPVSKAAFDKVTIGFTKLTGLCYASKENVRFANYSAEMLFRDDLAKSIIALADKDFVDPANAGTANVKPASITNGLTPTSPSGIDGDAVRADMQKVLQKIVQANLPLSEVTIITRDDLALALSLLTNALGQPEFPNMGPSGGTLLNMPVVVSNSVQPGDIIAVHTPSIYVADDGGVTLDVSTEASIEANDAPTQDGAAGTGASMISLWQSGMIGYKAEFFINWLVQRTNAVSNITTAGYNGAPSA